MLKEMQEIRKLALEFSKDQLGRMVQLGLIEPQKAMMAGMMIQRVEQQNAKPPQGTVAQNLLGIQPPGAPAMPQMAQGQPQMPPQMPPQGAPAAPPPMMAAEGGLMAIPAGDIGEYAGGGIVAFDDGGEVEGYAKGDLVPAGLFEALVQAESRGKQSAVSNKGARGVAQLMPGTMRDPGYGIKPVRDDSEEENRRVGREYLGAMLKKYRGNIDNALAAYNWGPGNVDKHLKKYGELTPEKLPKETQSYIPKVKNFLAQQRPMEPRPVRVAAAPQMSEMTDGGVPAGMLMPMQDSRTGMPSMLRGPLEKITRLLPSAEAGGLEELPAGMQARAEYARGGILGYAGRDGSLVGSKTNPGMIEDPLQERIMRDREARLLDILPFIAGPTSVTPGAEIPKAAITGNFGAYNVPEDQFPLQSYQDMMARRQQGVGYSDNGKIVRPGEAPPAPEAGGTAPPPLPPITRPQRDISSFEEKVTKATPRLPDFNKTEVKSLQDIGKERREAYAAEGYDPNFFDKIIQGIEKKKGAMASEKDIAAGQFLMTTGIELFGARRGKEAEAFSKGAQKGLDGYAKAMERLKDRQDKLDDRVEQLRIADANAKRTGAESDIARRSRLEEMKQNDERAVYQAQVQAATAGSQAAISLTVADMNLAGNLYQVDTNAQLRQQEIQNQKTYYDKSLKLAEARVKQTDEATQARFGKLKLEAGKMWEGSDENRKLMAALKDKFGDNFMKVPEAQARIQQERNAYVGYYLDQNNALMSNVLDATALLRE